MFRTIIWSYHFEREDYFKEKVYDIVDYKMFDNKEDAKRWGQEQLYLDDKYGFQIQEED